MTRLGPAEASFAVRSQSTAKEKIMTDDKSSRRAFRPFEDGHALTYTIREIHGSSREYQSQHRDLAEAADAFLRAALQARCVELRDRNGRVIASVQGGAP
jgi:hypothetical protein